MTCLCPSTTGLVENSEKCSPKHSSRARLGVEVNCFFCSQPLFTTRQTLESKTTGLLLKVWNRSSSRLEESNPHTTVHTPKVSRLKYEQPKRFPTSQTELGLSVNSFLCYWLRVPLCTCLRVAVTVTSPYAFFTVVPQVCTNNNQKSCAYFVVEVLEVTKSIRYFGIEVYQVRLFVTQRLERLRTFLVVLVHREVRATTLQRQTNAGCRPKPGNSDHR